MKVKTIRGTLAWTNPLRLKVRILPPLVQSHEAKPSSPPLPLEFDEEGRQWAFRYAGYVPRQYEIDRDRLFAYIKSHRLPNERMRRIRRDVRNAANFMTDVRDLQTHPDVQQTSS